MKKIFIFFLFAGFVFFLQNKINAQSQAEIIKVKGKGGGYYQNDVKLNNKMIRDIISSNPEAAKHFKKANNQAMVTKTLFVAAIALIIQLTERTQDIDAGIEELPPEQDLGRGLPRVRLKNFWACRRLL